MRHRFSVAAAAAVAAALCVAPGSAFALDTFVEPDTGSDANNCTQAAPGGAGVGPCATVNGGVTKAAPSGGTVRVDRGDTYVEGVFLLGGVSVVGQELDAPVDTGAAFIDGGAGTALSIAFPDTAGTIQDLRLHGDFAGVSASGAVAKITQNTFDDPTGSSGVRLVGLNSTQVSGNTFIGDGSSAQLAIAVGDGSSTITGNTIGAYWLGISAGGTSLASATSTPTISGNSITGIHQQTTQAGAGILINSGTNAVVDGNSVTAAGTGDSIGILVSGFSAPVATGATLRRNRVSGGYANGFSIKDTMLPTSSTSDVVTGSTGAGFEVGDQGPTDDPGVGDISIVNATAWGNLIDILTLQNTLTLDSSIVEDPISTASANCSISFSRGPTTSGTSCQAFQTTAVPQFVNAAGGDFHLQGTSPMIDAGNPAASSAGVLDFEGQPRDIDATPVCPLVPRRDIGADEFFVAQPFCPTAAPITQPIATPTPAKKCKKGQKLKKGKCVKKKRKRKKK